MAIGALASVALIFTGGATAASYHVEFAFKGGPDGTAPDVALTSFGGKFYGTTPQGGTHGDGALYVFDPSTGAETVLYSFQGGIDGYSP